MLAGASAPADAGAPGADCFLVDDDLLVDDLREDDLPAGASAPADAGAPVLDACWRDMLVDDLLEDDLPAGASAPADAGAPVLDVRWAARRLRCCRR